MPHVPSPLLTVVTPSFPPQVSGSTILLTNLLQHYPGEAHAIAGYDRDARSDPAFTTPCPTSPLGFPRRFPTLCDRLRRHLPMVSYHHMQRAIQRQMRDLKTAVVFGAFPDGVYLVATFLAAQQLRLPFYVHMHDLWLENTLRRGTAQARLAALWEPRILCRATRVLCMTEAMQKHYEKKYDIQAELLPHCIADRDLNSAPTALRPPRRKRPTILFVGAVSDAMNLDALKVLAEASELLPQDYALLFCTSSSREDLASLGIRSSRLQVQYVSRQEVQCLQGEVDVLVAPLSHKNGSPDEVRTVFSTKLLEYLIAGRPIVVFAPHDSYHATAAQKAGWGYVVTEDSPQALAAAIQQVATNTTLAASLVQGALREAHTRRASHHANRLYEWVQEDAVHSHAHRSYA
jgi:glycosyltransferase involved in cell wall biosynthesis